MNKQKLMALSLAASLLISSSFILSAEAAKNKPNSKLLKATVEDYRYEYINKNWWDKYDDPILKDYVLKAVSSNYNLKIATLKVAESRELMRESFGREFPVLNIGTDFSRQKTSSNVGFGSFILPSYTQNNYRFPLSVNYELDLWRKNRDITKSMEKGLEAVKYNEKATYISLISTVATAYFNVISTDKQIELQQDIIKLRQSILDMMKENNSYGLATTTDVIEAEKSLTEAETGIIDLRKQQSIFLNQLAVLTGDSVSNATSLKRTSIDDISFINDLPFEIKSEIVKERPDILKAEAEIQKLKLDVKVARKDFLPNINITGEFGFNANSFSKVFDWGSYIASFAPSITQNLFSGGQNIARLKFKKYQYQEMLENYQNTILVAFQEVNDSLASLKYDNQKNNNNIDRIKMEKENLYLMNIKYESGAISYLDTLQFKERVLTLEKEQVKSKADCFIDSLSLYKAVGGKL